MHPSVLTKKAIHAKSNPQKQAKKGARNMDRRLYTKAFVTLQVENANSHAITRRKESGYIKLEDKKMYHLSIYSSICGFVSIYHAYLSISICISNFPV